MHPSMRQGTALWLIESKARAIYLGVQTWHVILV